MLLRAGGWSGTLRPVRGDVEVFAVESRAVQLSWSHLPAREVTLEVGDRSVDVECAPPPWHRRWGRPLPAGLGGPGARSAPRKAHQRRRCPGHLPRF